MANKLSLKNRKPLRHQFGVLNDIADMPNLIEIQRSSYKQLLTSKTEENKEAIESDSEESWQERSWEEFPFDEQEYKNFIIYGVDVPYKSGDEGDDIWNNVRKNLDMIRVGGDRDEGLSVVDADLPEGNDAVFGGRACDSNGSGERHERDIVLLHGRLHEQTPIRLDLNNEI